MEAQLEKEAEILELQVTGRYSQDSAIDTDLQDWDTEILNIDLVNITSTNLKKLDDYIIVINVLYIFVGCYRT